VLFFFFEAIIKGQRSRFEPSDDGLDPEIDAFAIYMIRIFHRATRIAEIQRSMPLGSPVSFSSTPDEKLPCSPPKSTPHFSKSKQAMAPRPSSQHRAAALALLCLCSVSSSANGEY